MDRAALDVAMQLGMPCGGWCPKGRLAEDGEIPNKYPLQETPSSKYQVRTDWNIRDSDATIILNLGTLEGGSALTEVLAKSYGSPCLVIDMETQPDPEKLYKWLKDNMVSTLNIAGPRASKRPDAYDLATNLLQRFIPLARGQA